VEENLKDMLEKFVADSPARRYCHPDRKVSIGFMEGLNNKIRVIQRRAYGIKDQEYLMLKVITSFIKEPKSS